MNNDEIVKQVVIIAGRNYPLSIKKAESEQVQRAAALIDEKIKEYQGLYDGKDKQDYLAMLLLNFAVEHIHHQTQYAEYDTFVNNQLTQLHLLASAE